MEELQKKKEAKTKQKTKGKKSKFASVLQNIIIILIVLFNIVFITKAIRNPNKTPDFMGIKSFVIISGSMEPKIKIGDMVIIKSPSSDYNYKEGDIIAFREGTTVIVHRINKIMEVDGQVKYQTKGDNNNTPDKNLVERQNIEGVYKFHISKIGNIFMFIYKNFIYIIIVLLIVIIYKLIK